MRDRVYSWVDTLVTKDQQREQWFELTSDDVYAVFDPSVWFINLSHKWLTAVPDLCSLLNLADHHRVEVVSLLGNNIRIVSQDLSCLENLTILNLSYNNIAVVDSLWDLPNLSELYLHQNDIDSTDGFPRFPALEKLNLSYNNLRELWSDLTALDSLTVLELAHNQIESIVWIERLERLEQLKVEFNKLREIESIWDLTQLELVTARWNQLRESVIETLDEFNRWFIERNLGVWAANIWNTVIREIDAWLDNALNR